MAVTDGRIEAIDGDGRDVDVEAFLQCEFRGELREQSAIATAEIENIVSIADNGFRGGRNPTSNGPSSIRARRIAVRRSSSD